MKVYRKALPYGKAWVIEFFVETIGEKQLRKETLYIKDTGTSRIITTRYIYDINDIVELDGQYHFATLRDIKERLENKSNIRFNRKKNSFELV